MGFEGFERFEGGGLSIESFESAPKKTLFTFIILYTSMTYEFLWFLPFYLCPPTLKTLKTLKTSLVHKSGWLRTFYETERRFIITKKKGDILCPDNAQYALTKNA